jgi:hypothetical protein
LDHRLARLITRVHAQVFPSQLEVLAMTEAAPGIEDLVKDFKIARPQEIEGISGRLAAQGGKPSNVTGIGFGNGPTAVVFAVATFLPVSYLVTAGLPTAVIGLYGSFMCRERLVHDRPGRRP